MIPSSAEPGDFLEALMQAFERQQVNVDAENLADMLWLATKLPPEVVADISVEDSGGGNKGATEPVTGESRSHRSEASLSSLPTVPLTVSRPRQRAQSSGVVAAPGQPTVVTPAAPALKSPLELSRALRPLMRKVPSRTRFVFDEEATAIRMVEQPSGWMPVLVPAKERWLSLTLVVDQSPAAGIWQEIIDDFQRVLARQGAFQDVRAWRLAVSASGQIQLFSKPHVPISQQQPRPPKELIDPSGRHLVLLVSDGLSALWRSPDLYDCLQGWAKVGPVAWLQLLSERLWQRSAIGSGVLAQLSSWLPGVANTQLEALLLSPLDDIEVESALKLPVITLQPEPIVQWANVVAGSGNARIAGVLFEPFTESLGDGGLAVDESTALSLTARERVNRFRATASPIARRLAVFMSLVPVSLPVVYLLQQTCLPQVRQVHIAEVFMSGLLVSVDEQAGEKQAGSETRYYEFFQGGEGDENDVRAILNKGVPRSQVDDILNAVSGYIADKAGLTARSFMAVLARQGRGEAGTDNPQVHEFARITKEVLYRLGGSHRSWVEALDEIVIDDERTQEDEFPLQAFEFEAAKVRFEESGPEIVLLTQTLDVGWLEVDATESESELQPFEFETARLERRRRGILQRRTELVVRRRSGQGSQFLELLDDDVALEMVAIASGNFLMGAPDDEEEGYDDERPIHSVSVEAFFMAKTPVTQAQWRAVAALDQINRELRPAPSRFEGDDLPVEQVSWHEAVEFCDRLSAHTGRTYVLPTEAQWEYACRSGTTTPFAFGETIRKDLVNYDSKSTSTVGEYPANAFGLYDMHGNVWEWCLDHWHEDYEGAPEDGSAWLTGNEKAARLLRGGSWISTPRHCRSASRLRSDPDDRDSNLGFRVVCLPQDSA